jgi:uncharacterized protein YndB with AHSA1/START domain
MRAVTTSHHTVVVKRILDATPARVFAAFADNDALRRWYVPGDGSWSSKIIRHEFKVGGGHLMTFGPAGETQYTEDCRYEDIIDGQRICYVMTVLRDKERLTTSMVTVEIAGQGKHTALTVTDQLVILVDEDTAEGRARGWGDTLDKLPAELARQAA